MKKLLLSCMLLAGVAATSITEVKAQAYEQGNQLINAGVGFGGTFTGSGWKSTLPPIGISYEYGFHEKISAGAYLGYSAAEDELGLGWKATYLIFGARGSWHFEMGDKFDPYVGLMVGYNKATLELTGGGIAADPSAVLYGGHLGARYLFTDNIGAFAELGYGIAYLQLGASLKF